MQPPTTASASVVHDSAQPTELLKPYVVQFRDNSVSGRRRDGEGRRGDGPEQPGARPNRR